jgi:hypothetical protein
VSGGVGTDELAMLAAGFEGALRAASSPAAADASLFDLGWDELLAAAPLGGAAIAFTALGATGVACGLLDDVVAAALGHDVSPDVAVVLPAPMGSTPPGRRSADRIVVDGVVSTRLDGASTVLVPVARSADAVELAPVAAHLLEVGTSATLDPDRAVRQVRCTIPAPPSTALTPTGDWSAAVAAARVALAHQLIAAARTMLDQARTHAVDRAQFGRPVASFQAVRHRLADSLVAIEGAAAVAAACTDQPGPAAIDPLLAATAKSLAGEAAQVTADHAQQVLAGIGFTTDHPYQRWMKRVLTIDTLFGSASSLPGEIGAELLRRGRAPRLVEL